MLLKLENVRKEYGDFSLECSMQLQQGQITGLIGQNGAGKSTTFKAILDLIKIDGGSIELFDKDSKEVTRIEREQIGAVLAESGFSTYLKIKDIIPILRNTYKNFDEQAFTSYCKKFNLPMNQKIKEFSSGMKAKLKVLVAITHGARLLILDEPTAGLDVVARNELLDVLREFIEKYECGILISSHISSDLEGLCDDIYMIHNGKVILHEDTDVMLSDYGLLKMTKEQYDSIEKKYLLKVKKEVFGYVGLTNQKMFYVENYPSVTIEKGSIDEIILMMI